MLLDALSSANLLLREDSGGSPLALQGVWGLLSFPADCQPICSQRGDSFLPRSPSSFPKCWLPDKHILAALVLCSSRCCQCPAQAGKGPRSPTAGGVQSLCSEANLTPGSDCAFASGQSAGMGHHQCCR